MGGWLQRGRGGETVGPRRRLCRAGGEGLLRLEASRGLDGGERTREPRMKLEGRRGCRVRTRFWVVGRPVASPPSQVPRKSQADAEERRGENGSPCCLLLFPAAAAALAERRPPASLRRSRRGRRAVISFFPFPAEFGRIEGPRRREKTNRRPEEGPQAGSARFGSLPSLSPLPFSLH